MAVDASNLTLLQLDALKEVGNIGAGHAATSLADLLGEHVVITVPNASIVATAQLATAVSRPESTVVGVLLRISGQAGGVMVYAFDEADARRMADTLTMQPPGTTQEIGELERSMVGEVGNMLTGAFVTALAEFTNLRFEMSPPMIAVDTLATILSEVSVTAAALGDYALEMDTTFVQARGRLEGRFFYLMDENALTAILTSLGMAG